MVKYPMPSRMSSAHAKMAAASIYDAPMPGLHEPRAHVCAITMSTPVFRFAPSPNGYLHLGHALSALINFDMARATGGRFLLRIEDIDVARCRPHYEQAIYQDLTWLGITWEEPVRRQSAQLDGYRA